MTIEVFNEVCILLTTYLVIVFSNYVKTDKIKRNAGWVYFGLIIFMVAVNYAFNITELINLKIREKNKAAY